ncbi:unconventional myosin-IXAa isoform X4 [Polypterus senegalus]|uniref:unconventional myosin-IXAa isoform X4 n=1 Tax=Polypterus senegalus TaxID=55291 RepID=UPI0019647D3A|nr:unconventional myosin-IXAa isoform X4 [Polypterus senegalus]
MNVHDVGGRRRFEDSEFTLRIYPGSIAEGTIYCPVSARKITTAAEVIDFLINKLQLDKTKCYVLAEVKEFGGEEWILNPTDCPVQRMMLWPRMALENRFSSDDYRFLLREKNLDGSIHYGNLQMWLRVTEERRRMVERGFLPQPQQKDYDDLCNLPDLNEKTLLDNLRSRFKQEKIYTYVGSILIVINPFKFLPIYNPKYVKMYDNHHLGKLEPHIYAVADVAYHAMLQRRKNQCIVISGESGSGKTQSTNFLIHHLTALSQKGFASGVEQIILGAGPVLEAFGNAKTAHNNNSSRFGKFIQVNYQETGTVRGAYVEKYLLEKSRLVYQEHNERNYHVFYYLLAGATEEERAEFHLKKPEEYHYLNQDCFTVEGEDLKHDFERLQLAMEMVGFLPQTRKQIFSLLSAILHLGNIRYKKKTYRDDSIDICNPEVLPVVSELLEVKEEMLFEALTTRKTVTVGEKLIVPYKLAEAGTVRDSMAKSLYSALFDWIVFRINHALFNTKDLEETTKILSIGVLDIFGFEDYENNSFEQFCINFANERLQHYFNQHIFKIEQEEYRLEGISWHNIDYIDNSGCINLISKKPTALFHLLDEECNFPQATNQTLLDKFKRQHEGNSYIEFPAVMEPAFIIRHYAGKVKYGVKDFREKNTDHMRPDIVALLKSSKNSFICGLIGIDPVATFRWAVLRSYFRAVVAFREAGKRYVDKKTGHDDAVPCPILKNVDSFSFLHHPVHQRSLEILQRCKEEKYSITRKSPRTPLSNLQGVNTMNEKSQRDSFNMNWNGRMGRQNRVSVTGSFLEEEGIFVNSASSKLLERAHGILMRNKTYKPKPTLPKHLLDVKSLKYLTSLTLQDRITKSLLHLHKKKKPPSISAQFQASLNKLMETLEQAEPYFVKCIRSNSEKLPLRFNDGLVLRQLRYTGMLETVRIRQSGYSIKYTFQEFVDHFHVLLSKGTHSSRQSILEFLRNVDLNPDGFQVGITMVFMKEVERQKLQDLLHQEVLRRIVVLQRWFRTQLERKHFLIMKNAAICIQRWWRNCTVKDTTPEPEIDIETLHGAAICIQALWRGYKERKKIQHMWEASCVIQKFWRRYCYHREEAAVCIQAAWRGWKARTTYRHLRFCIVLLQAYCRGHLARLRLIELKNQKQQQIQLKIKEANSLTAQDLYKGDIPSAFGCTPKDINARVKEPETVIERRNENMDYYQSEYADSTTADRTTDNQYDWLGIQGGGAIERPKSFDDMDQKKVVRAKRESRRMRELEQAKFSLELLKVRSTGGISPSEEIRWSTELVSENLLSPQGTPDSESSRGSFELLGADEFQKVKSTSPELEESDCHHKFIEQQDLSSGSTESPHVHPAESEMMSSTGPSSSPQGKSQGLLLKSKTENNLPPFYIPFREGVSANKESNDSSKTSFERDSGPKGQKVPIHKPVVVVISMQKEVPLGEETQVQKPQVKHSEVQTEISTTLAVDSVNKNADDRVNAAIIEKLEKMNVGKAERQKQQQQQNEKEMMEQIRQQKEILEKQRKFFEQHERDMFEKQRGEALQKIEQNRQLSSNASSHKERPQSLLLSQEHWGPSAPSELSPSDVEIKIISVEDGQTKEKKVLPPSAKERPLSMFLEKRDGPWRLPQEGWNPKVTLEAPDGGPRSERLRQPKVLGQSLDGSSADRPTTIFFTPKDNKPTFTKVEKESANQERSSAIQKEEPFFNAKHAKMPLEVGRPAQKKKARMARTRSDFLSRGTNPAGDGELEDDEYDDNPITSPLSPCLPHPEMEPVVSDGQACHSDSEMSTSLAEDTKKMHKALSSGDLVKMDSIRKNAHTDSRMKAKMRFWGKPKQGNKKLLRDKVITQPDKQEFLEDHDETDGLMIYDVGQEVNQHRVTPPHSPNLGAERGKEFKENKEPSPKVRRRKSVKISNVTIDTTQWQNDCLQILTSASDYKSMNEFLQKKIDGLDTEDGKKDTLVDVVFKKALREFRHNIFNSYSTALAMDDGKTVRYKDLYALFEHILEKTMRQEQRDWSESPVRVWVNTFKVFLDEFMTEYKTLDSTAGKVQKLERKKRRKKDADIVEEHNGHIFKATQYSIPTYCEYCSSLIWMMDKACVCKLCRYACHRKCCLKTTTKCSKKYDTELSSRQFGVDVSRLTNDERTVPLVVEKLINYIEMHGLYTEGIYRKSGSTNKIKELKQGLDSDIYSTNLDDYNIHVIASVFKQWLRDLPNPLMTFELYEEFVRAMGLQDKKEVVRGVYSVIDQLSRTHLNTLERLIFHLVRIAFQEETNRMSANALAIVFAPCILRCPDTIDPLQSVQDIGKTTACVELIIGEQMNKYKARLKDINSLEFAENKAKSRLSLIRRSMKPVLIAVRFMSITRNVIPPNSSRKGKGRLRRSSYHTPSSPVGTRLPSVSDVPEESASEDGAMEVELSEQQQKAMQQEEQVLTEQIENLQKEKEELTYEMLSLEPRASDDETLESEASIGTADSSENLNMDSEGTISDFSDRNAALVTCRQNKKESSGKARRTLRKQQESFDSVDSASTVSSMSSTGAYQGRGHAPRFRSHPAFQPNESTDSRLNQDAGEQPQFTSRGTFNPEKGKLKLKTMKSSPQKTKEPSDEGGKGAGRKKNTDSDLPSSQQLVVYGKNEFMV